jgi:Uma2 family endonuclease
MSIVAPQPPFPYKGHDYDPLYPDSDGQPMADNTVQFRYIVMIEGGVDALFADRDDVFVAGDLLWYPVEGHPEICAAPDAMVVFGRPKGDRRSYKQWLEDGLAPQVVFEILSPRNTAAEMREKLDFYDRYGVCEYYLYNPMAGTVRGWERLGGELCPIREMEGWVSPRLGVRFELGPVRSPDASEELPLRDLLLFAPDGSPFVTFVEAIARSRRLEAERNETRTALERAEAERQRADEERQRAAAERDAERQARERLAARLRELGVDPDTLDP